MRASFVQAPFLERSATELVVRLRARGLGLFRSLRTVRSRGVTPLSGASLLPVHSGCSSSMYRGHASGGPVLAHLLSHNMHLNARSQIVPSVAMAGAAGDLCSSII